MPQNKKRRENVPNRVGDGQLTEQESVPDGSLGKVLSKLKAREEDCSNDHENEGHAAEHETQLLHLSLGVLSLKKKQPIALRRVP